MEKEKTENNEQIKKLKFGKKHKKTIKFKLKKRLKLK